MKRRRTLRLREDDESETGPVRGERLLDVKEAAAMLSLKPATLYQWAYERRIPVVKLGKPLRFRLSTIEKLIADCERPALRSPHDRECP